MRIKSKVIRIAKFIKSFTRNKNSVFLNEKQTVDFILKNHSSFIRIGDGEFNLMEGRSIDYQKFDKKLSKSLKRYILMDEKNILIGMPGKYLKGTGINLLKSRVHFSSWTHVRYYYKNFLSMYKRTYGDAFLFGKGKNNIYDKIWLNSNIKKIIFVHNNEKYAKYFEKKYGIETVFVKVPSKNAYDEKNEIIKKITNIKDYNKPNVQILVSAGPAGKVIVYNLANLGCWAIDTGHCWDDPLTE